MNWSGGKDSSLCLYKAIQEKKYNIEYLLTSVNKTHKRISMHGVRQELLYKQAEAIGIPLKLVELSEKPEMGEYETEMEKKVLEIKNEGIHNTLFGDIFLEDLRKYREEKLSQLGITAHFPLWNIPSLVLMEEFISLGFKAIIVCINEKFLDKSFCGRIIDENFVKDLPKDVDICGENGEYHSFVFDGPIFTRPVEFKKGEIVYKEYPKPKTDKKACFREPRDYERENYGFYFCDLLPG
jgi:uncharacterized protein (TIGR00290 family)